MTDDDHDFVLDISGNLVLVGLTLEETIEFEVLDNSITANGPLLHISRDESHRPEEKRWLELWDKHQAANAPFTRTSKTTSLSASEINRPDGRFKMRADPSQRIGDNSEPIHRSREEIAPANVLPQRSERRQSPLDQPGQI
jgi:hypothetical protein